MTDIERLDLDILKLNFWRLKLDWKEATGLYSDMHMASKHSAYQSIIKMGYPIVPILIEDMVEYNTHWFIALSTITGINPIKKENAGRIALMAKDWENWWKMDQRDKKIDSALNI